MERGRGRGTGTEGGRGGIFFFSFSNLRGNEREACSTMSAQVPWVYVADQGDLPASVNLLLGNIYRGEGREGGK